MLRTALIGLGGQALEDHLPALTESEHFTLAAVCDVDRALTNKIATSASVEGFDNLEVMLQECQLDVAVVAVPHNQYLPIITQLAAKGVHIIKEKPFATCMQEARAIHDAVAGKVFLGVTLQRRFNPIYQAFPQMQRRIGKLYSIEGKYTLSIAKLDEGWRASKEHAGGGALIDMGYHFVDLLVWYMGMPQTVTARISRGNRPEQKYDVEDTVNMLFDYYLPQSYAEKTVGNFLISRVYPQKLEVLTVYGTKGVVELKRGEICRFNNNGDEVEKLTRQHGWPSALIDQINFFAEQIALGKRWGAEDRDIHLQHIAIIEAAYDSDKRATSCNPTDFLKAMEE